MDGKDGHAIMKLEEVGPTFSSFDALPAKISNSMIGQLSRDVIGRLSVKP